MGKIAWTVQSNNENSGVDHLGMRVAGEQAYSKMIDFNTTVAWRPRYFSLFCWLTRYAFKIAGGNSNLETNNVDIKLYQRIIKHVEYLIAAATLLAEKSVTRIAGSTKILEEIARASKQGNETISIKGDHLRAPTGGLSIYGGPLHALNLLATSAGVDIPLPGSKGDYLANSFERSVNRHPDFFKAITAPEVQMSELIQIGMYCNLHNIAQSAKTDPQVNEELELLRDCILDWNHFRGGSGPSARRIMTVGLILESRRMLKNETSSLDRFRELTLLRAVMIEGEIIQLNLPNSYNNILDEWQAYQIHAYTTFALEALLGALLYQGFELQDALGDKLTQEMLVLSAIDSISPGALKSSISLHSDLENWWELGLGELKDKLLNLVKEKRIANNVEPEFMAAIELNTKKIDTANFSVWIHDAAFMFLLVQVRQLDFYKNTDKATWLGSEEEFRLPPKILVKHFNLHLEKGSNVKEFLTFVLNKLVLSQHETNALRKLMFQPTQDTSKFIKQGSGFQHLSNHIPGTSNPRYDNTIMYLQDLGFLTYDNKPVPTKDGDLLVEDIKRLSH